MSCVKVWWCSVICASQSASWKIARKRGPYWVHYQNWVFWWGCWCWKLPTETFSSETISHKRFCCMLCLNRMVVLGEARIGNSFESGAGQDVSSAWPIRLFLSVLWLARLAFWEKRKQQRNVVTMHSLKVRSSNCVLSLIVFVDSSSVYSWAFCCADTRWWVTNRYEGLVHSPPSFWCYLAGA